MDFTPNDEQRALQAAVRDLAATLTPQDAGDGAPAGPQPFDPVGWSALAEMGLFGLPFAEADGGFGASAIEVTLAASELGAARVALPYADAMAAAAALAGAVASRAGASGASGASAQGSHLAELLTDVIGGEKLVLTAFGEKGATWAPDQPSRVVDAAGHDSADPSVDTVTLTGAALGNVDLSAADAVVTTAIAGGEVGVYLVEAPVTDGASVTFDGAQAVRLGGHELLDAALAMGNVAQCGEALGAMGAALMMTTEYLKTRKQFGVPIMRFQTLTQRAADMYVSVELTRSAVLFAAMTLADASARATSGSGSGSDDTRAGAVSMQEVMATVSRTKYLVGTYGRHVGQEAIQLHGGIGMTAEYAVGHYTSRLAAIERTFGDTRHHLAKLAADVEQHDSVDVI